MAQIIVIHSFRRGTGKSSVAANLAVLWAAAGRRVGVVDVGLQFPSLPILFGLDQAQMAYTLDDYLLGKRSIEQATQDITAQVDNKFKGRLFLTVRVSRQVELAHVLRSPYDLERLGDGFYALVNDLNLDILLLDTHAGLDEESLIALTFADVLALILRPDQQDYQGTAITIQVVEQLDVPRPHLIVNAVPASFDLQIVERHVSRTYQCPVASVLPHSLEFMTVSNDGIFVLRQPDHPMTQRFKRLADNLVSDTIPQTQ
jgi:MinD-like ATPase involved in chromosome partitioning or flagellar assembly